MHCYYVLLFFFFKQKTAYEMRISDWSSDVCSSDLRRPGVDRPGIEALPAGDAVPCRGVQACPAGREQSCRGTSQQCDGDAQHGRSEEHTSELQSLMRISYAVFCLKKKKETHVKI